MGLFSQIKTWFVLHLLLGYIFITSGLIITFLMLLSCVIYPINKHLYRKINIHLAYSHWCQFTFLAQWWAGCESLIYISPEDLKYIGTEHNLVVMNHKYDIDWLMAWILAERFGLLGGTKIFGKEMLKYVPLIGWAWYFTESIFLKRNWDKDRQTMVEDLKKVSDYPENYWVTLLLFPEGTRFTETKHAASLEVSRAKGYPPMKHHLLPRPKGFILTMHGFRGKVPAIYDLTVAFDRKGPEPTLMNVIQGKPLMSYMNVRRFLIEDVPISNDEDGAAWLRKLFLEKDELYDSFVKYGCFPGKPYTKRRRLRDLLFWMFWAVVTCIPLFKYLGQLFLSGTYTQQFAFIGVVFTVSLIIRWMISVTETHKGSSYGVQTIKHKTQ